MGSKLRQRIEVTCPICGKPFNVELEVSTYVTAESAVSTVGKQNLSTILQGQQAKVDFVLRAMKALASKEPSGMVEVSDVIDIAEKVGLSKEPVQEILNGEKNAGRIYEPKPGVVCFTLPQERAKS
jgi:DNA replicative helicase MCM subunit Mcm2 (Cdc46/Mcm family)